MPSFPKPEPRAKVKARKDREWDKARHDCLVVVYQRARCRCERCNRAVLPPWDELATEWTVGHAHEPKRRSLGADATDPNQVDLLCRFCHQLDHRR